MTAAAVIWGLCCVYDRWRCSTCCSRWVVEPDMSASTSFTAWTVHSASARHWRRSLCFSSMRWPTLRTSTRVCSHKCLSTRSVLSKSWQSQSQCIYKCMLSCSSSSLLTLSGWPQTWKTRNTQGFLRTWKTQGILREFRAASGKNCNKESIFSSSFKYLWKTAVDWVNRIIVTLDEGHYYIYFLLNL